MELFADRFAVWDERAARDGRAIDLASGADVQLVTSSAGGAFDERRWALRCDRFHRLRHRAVARLVDFGACGEGRRFEAWECGPMWDGDGGTGDHVVRSAHAFFHHCGLSVGPIGRADVRVWRGTPIVLPDATCGYEIGVGGPGGAGEAGGASEAGEAGGVGLADCGIHIVSRRAVTAIGESFAQTLDARPRAVALWGPPGAGVGTAVQELARAARLHGFVPMALSVMNARTAQLLRGRSICLIVHGVHGTAIAGWRALVEWSLISPMSHVVLFAGRREVAHVDGVALDAIPTESLVNALEPRCVDGRMKRRVEAAAHRSQGLPGRFVRQLWGVGADVLSAPGTTTDMTPVTTAANRHAGRAVTRAAEQTAIYGAQPSRSDGTTTLDGSGEALALVPPIAASLTVASWPAPGELATLRRRLESAIAVIESGRHEPGVRALRQAIGGLARRHEWGDAARGALALARALLVRGRSRDAQAVLTEAQDYVARTDGDSCVWIDAAVLAGVAWTDLARLDEAENILHGAVQSSRACRSPELMVAARLALARCLFWRGRYDEADQTLAAMDTVGAGSWPEPTSVRLAIAMSRVAVGRGEGGAAVSHASAALDAAEKLGDPSLVAHAACAAAFARLGVGDRVALERDIATCIRASRAARDPLCALRARLLGAEQERRTGQSRTLPALLRRIARIPAGNMPAIVRARCALLGDLVALCSMSPTSSAPSSSGSMGARSTGAADIVKRHVAATGLSALALFTPVGRSEAQRAEHAAIDDTLDVLRCCQTADEGLEVLGTVVRRLRTRLNAAAIACISREGLLLACDGGRIGTALGERVLAAGQPISPHLFDGSIEGGAPVRYGGEPIAALVGRWTLGTPHDVARVTMALTLAATAAGPAVAEAIGRSKEAPARALGDIYGVSRVMEEVRHAIERAAGAPFAVLIEGESGSGKELVARALHRHGVRRDRPFCGINCAALPDDLVESELFGHARGAFTGAVAERPGVFEEAHTGTLFLDEIGELSARAQAKILRTIQEGELRRVGENIARRVDVRIVAATNRDLRQEAAAGRFRMDLLYRIDVIRITVPPLRDRREDIALLADRFWREATARVGSRAALGSSTLAALAAYDWPGNVRELQNVLAALAVRTPKRGVVPPTSLPPPFLSAQVAESWQLDQARRAFDDRFVRAALVRTGGHRAHAAEQLGVTRQGLTKLMTRLGIE